MNDPRVAASQMTATTGTVRLTAAQALVRYLAALRAETGLADVGTAPLFGGVFAIFGHGNVAGIGQALLQAAGLGLLAILLVLPVLTAIYLVWRLRKWSAEPVA